MRTKRNREIADSLDLILTFLAPYMIGLGNVLCYLFVRINPKSWIVSTMPFFLYPSILFCIFLMIASVRNRMCPWHFAMIMSNLMVVVATLINETVYPFSRLGIDIFCNLFVFQTTCIIVAAVLNWKYGTCEK